MSPVSLDLVILGVKISLFGIILKKTKMALILGTPDNMYIWRSPENY